jgi:hypothetical protein
MRVESARNSPRFVITPSICRFRIPEKYRSGSVNMRVALEGIPTPLMMRVHGANCHACLAGRLSCVNRQVNILYARRNAGVPQTQHSLKRIASALACGMGGVKSHFAADPPSRTFVKNA